MGSVTKPRPDCGLDWCDQRHVPVDLRPEAIECLKAIQDGLFDPEDLSDEWMEGMRLVSQHLVTSTDEREWVLTAAGRVALNLADEPDAGEGE